MRMRVSVIAVANTRGRTTVTAFMKCPSIRWKVFGLCCDHGFVLIEASPKTTCRSSWDALSLCTTRDDEAKRCWKHYLGCYSRSSPEHKLSHFEILNQSAQLVAFLFSLLAILGGAHVWLTLTYYFDRRWIAHF